MASWKTTAVAAACSGGGTRDGGGGGSVVFVLLRMGAVNPSFFLSPDWRGGRRNWGGKEGMARWWRDGGDEVGGG